MVDIPAILANIKDKVLDATHFELLQHAYDLQNQNVEQLTRNNEALRESNELLKGEVARLKVENESSRITIESLKSRLAALPNDSELCADEVKILVHLSSCGEYTPTAEAIAASVGLNPTRAEYYLERMWGKYVYAHEWTDGRPPQYYLYHDGKAYLVRNRLA